MSRRAHIEEDNLGMDVNDEDDDDGDSIDWVGVTAEACLGLMPFELCYSRTGVPRDDPRLLAAMDMFR